MDLNQAMELNQQLAQIVAALRQLRTGVTQAKTAGQEEFEHKRETFYQGLSSVMNLLQNLQNSTARPRIYSVGDAMKLLGALNNISPDYSIETIDAAIDIAVSQQR
jgi:hypothetical protein